MEQIPSVAEVERIAALDDPASRNLQITQCYHQLSSAMSKRTGVCANWCTFATWASKQAGQTIRHEDMARALEHFLVNMPDIKTEVDHIAAVAGQAVASQKPGYLRQLIWQALDPAAATERAGDAVGRGNKKVFEEIGREFARFAAGCLNDPAPDAENIARFCDVLRPGDPPEGQGLLRQAFLHYYQAFFEADHKAKMEYILMANLKIGLHEQTRLQPEIAEALEAGLADPHVFMRRLVNALFPYRGWLIYAGALFMRFIGRPAKLDVAIRRYFTAAQHHLRLFLTEHLMALGFPDGLRLRLGHDLKAKFPAVFRKIANPDLLLLLEQIDPTPDSLQETGAADWADLPERLHFIADLFRCYHETADLLKPPFSVEQVVAIKAGQVPGGEM